MEKELISRLEQGTCYLNLTTIWYQAQCNKTEETLSKITGTNIEDFLMTRARIL